MAGGVADYTEQLARALSGAGEEVHVWAPGDIDFRKDGAVSIHGVRNFGLGGLRRLSADLSRTEAPRRLFVQYVAPAFGLRGANIPFCIWLANRDKDEVWVQFHEVAHAFAWLQPPKHNALALAQWWMAQIVAGRAQRVFMSVPGWRRQLGQHGTRAEVLPIPSNVPSDVDRQEVASLRAQIGAGPLIGHFGTYGHPVTDLLAPTIVLLLRSVPEARFLLLGRGSAHFVASIALTSPDIAGRLVAPGTLEPARISTHLAACDILVQPYPDGISGRRTSAMAGLALGRPIITTSGHLTENEWRDAEAALLTSVGQTEEITRAAIRLLASKTEREALGFRGRTWYGTQFSMAKTLERLLGSPRLEVD